MADTSAERDKEFNVNQGSLAGLCTQDYKYLCAAVALCATVFTRKLHFDPCDLEN